MAASNATAARAARFLDRLVSSAPFPIEAVQVDEGSEFMAGFEEACAAKGITLAVLPPKSPENERTRRDECRRHGGTSSTMSRTPPSNVAELAPLIDEYLAFYNGWRPHDALDGMTPDEYLESRRIGEAPPSPYVMS